MKNYHDSDEVAPASPTPSSGYIAVGVTGMDDSTTPTDDSVPATNDERTTNTTVPIDSGFKGPVYNDAADNTRVPSPPVGHDAPQAAASEADMFGWDDDILSI